jgi:hypothetical protein
MLEALQRSACRTSSHSTVDISRIGSTLRRSTERWALVTITEL